MVAEHGESEQPRTEHGNCHTEPCRSLRCPCFISGEHDPTGADHLAEMMEHAQRADTLHDENERLREVLEAIAVTAEQVDEDPPPTVATVVIQAIARGARAALSGSDQKVQP